MFPKAILAFLAIGALSANALNVHVARSPAPEPGSQELEARMFLLSRELQALDQLFSRERADRARSRGMTKRQLSPVLEARGNGQIGNEPPVHRFGTFGSIDGVINTQVANPPIAPKGKGKRGLLG